MKLTTKTAILLLGSSITLFSSADAERTCSDNKHFRLDKHTNKNCEWLAKENKCDLATHTEGETVGSRFCPVSCGTCDEQPETSIVSTDQLCYHHDVADDHIRISFENHEPRSDDWVGIYQESADSNDLGEPLEWRWLCGPHHDKCKVLYDDSIYFHAKYLTPGTYKAVLSRHNHGGSYSSYAESVSFQVSKDGQPCAGRRDLIAMNFKKDDISGCHHQLNVDKLEYTEGEDIVVSFENCVPKSGDFLAIYDADTEVEDIKGDANYKQWMWTCGNQRCHEPVGINEFAFSKKNAKHTWPLAAGKYQVHLIKRKEGSKHGAFHSVIASSEFTVVKKSNFLAEKIKRNLDADENEAECVDEIVALSTCYTEGETIQVGLRNECTSMEPKAWIGFYLDEPNKEHDDKFFGEPLRWMHTCHEDDECNNRSSTLINFKRHQEEDEEALASFLKAGTYRAIFVNGDYRHHGPYTAEMISEPFEIHSADEPCEIAPENETA